MKPDPNTLFMSITPQEYLQRLPHVLARLYSVLGGKASISCPEGSWTVASQGILEEPEVLACRQVFGRRRDDLKHKKEVWRYLVGSSRICIL